MRSWSRESVLACATISLLAFGSRAPASAQPAPAKTPAIALADSGDLAQWQAWSKELGWRVIEAPAGANANLDERIQALDKAVLEAIQSGSVDPARVYLAGRGDACAAVFYTVARVPDLWAAAVALGGSPQPSINSDRLYAANFTNVPVLWIGAAAGDQAVADKLKSAGIPLEWRSGESVNIGAVLEWMARHTRSEYPTSIDCETNSPAFARCYWIQMTKFDAAERNDVLPSSRVPATVSPALDLGGFGFKTDDPGPGVLVTYLPEKYRGPLKMDDRIAALDGREISDARRFVEMMAQFKEERPAVATVLRGKERIRVETRVVLPKRAPSATARAQAQYRPEEKQVQIVSRTVTGMRVTVPPQWVPSILNWNGVPVAELNSPGCRLLVIEKAVEKATTCP